MILATTWWEAVLVRVMLLECGLVVNLFVSVSCYYSMLHKQNLIYTAEDYFANVDMDAITYNFSYTGVKTGLVFSFLGVLLLSV